MDIRITPGPLKGSIRAIPSKSDVHRLLICAALADEPTVIRMGTSSDDIEATARCLRALGSVIDRAGDLVTVFPIRTVPHEPFLDCGESGSTLRFLLPTAAALCPSVRFAGRGRLPERPLGPLIKAMESHGVSFSRQSLPFMTTGSLKSGRYSIPGNISSQFITGLMLALSAQSEDSSIELETELESSSYVEITLRILKKFGIEVIRTRTGWELPSGQIYRSPGEAGAEGDWSNSGFFLAAGALGSDITVTGLDIGSPQSDATVADILASFGAGLEASSDRVRIVRGPLTAQTIDVREIPDALPILSVVAACSFGETGFIHAGRLRFKESDRLSATARMIRSLGGIAAEEPDGLKVRGAPLTGGTVSAENDHRIVMAAAIAATVCTGPVTITGAEAVHKSYPQFFDDYAALGGKVDVL